MITTIKNILVRKYLEIKLKYLQKREENNNLRIKDYNHNVTRAEYSGALDSPLIQWDLIRLEKYKRKGVLLTSDINGLEQRLSQLNLAISVTG